MDNVDLESRLTTALLRKHSDHVAGVKTRHGEDWTGDPAVWIWVLLKDDTLIEQHRREEINSIHATAEDLVSEVSNEWPYVSFRTEAEQREVEELERLGKAGGELT